jgi:hypothetical protein
VLDRGDLPAPVASTRIVFYSRFLVNVPAAAKPQPSKPEQPHPDWRGLWLRIQRSCVTTLDLFRIMFFDAVILILGNGIVQLTAKFVTENDGFFRVASRLSQGLFLLLYVIVVTFHIVEFFQEQRRGSEISR